MKLIAKTLKDIIGNQNLIVSLLKQKLEVINFISWGFENELPAFSNEFIRFTTHTYYRNAIIDVCALFQHDSKNQKCNFHLLIDEKMPYIKELNATEISQIRTLLEDAKTILYKDIVTNRHNNIAHYAPRVPISISFDHNYLPQLNALFEISLKIINIAMSGCMVGFPSNAAKGLGKMVKDLSGTDYYTIWKSESQIAEDFNR